MVMKLYQIVIKEVYWWQTGILEMYEIVLKRNLSDMMCCDYVQNKLFGVSFENCDCCLVDIWVSYIRNMHIVQIINRLFFIICSWQWPPTLSAPPSNTIKKQLQFCVALSFPTIYTLRGMIPPRSNSRWWCEHLRCLSLPPIAIIFVRRLLLFIVVVVTLLLHNFFSTTSSTVNQNIPKSMSSARTLDEVLAPIEEQTLADDEQLRASMKRGGSWGCSRITIDYCQVAVGIKKITTLITTTTVRQQLRRIGE